MSGNKQVYEFFYEFEFDYESGDEFALGHGYMEIEVYWHEEWQCYVLGYDEPTLYFDEDHPPRGDFYIFPEEIFEEEIEHQLKEDLLEEGLNPAHVLGMA